MNGALYSIFSIPSIRDEAKAMVSKAQIFFVICYLSVSRSSQCSTTGVTKAVVCVILSVGWCI